MVGAGLVGGVGRLVGVDLERGGVDTLHVGIEVVLLGVTIVGRWTSDDSLYWCRS